MEKPIKIMATFFFLGYSPIIPGTMGSLAGMAIYLLVRDNLTVYIGVSIFLTVVGFLFSGKAEEIFREKDCCKIVIDEVCGMCLCFLFIPFNIKSLILGFFLFRLFDVVKPYPARQVQNLKGSAGIMLDDIIAAVYTNIVLQIFHLFCIK